MDLAVSHWVLSWLSGSLSTLSPCVFPLLPMVLAGVVQGHRWGPLVMGIGMALTFASVGVLLGALGPVLGLDAEHLRMLGAVLLMLMGLVIWVPALNQGFTQWMTPLASSANAMSAHLQGHTLWSALMLGALPMLSPFMIANNSARPMKRPHDSMSFISMMPGANENLKL